MTKFLNDINLSSGNDIQFKTTANVNAGKISQTGDDLVISNAVGDILLGNGSDDVYIGDGTNTVDIRFEQNMAIFADSGSAKTLTLGGSNTNLVLESPTLNSATFGATTINNKLTFTTSNGYIVFDYEPSGDTGEYSGEVPLIKIDHNGTEKTILSRVSENGALQLGHDDTIAITAGDIGDTVKTNWGMTNENVVLAAESGLYVWGWPNNHSSPYNTWASRYEFRFRTNHYDSSASDPAADALATNGLYLGSGSSTQFIDMSRNLKNIGTISSGAITSSGQITGTELEGTSLDINGNADISGTLDLGGDLKLDLGDNIRFGGQLAITKENNGELKLYGGTNATDGGFEFFTWDGSAYNSSLTLKNDNNATFAGNITTAGNIILSGASNEIIKSNGSIRLNIDSDANQTDRIFIVSTGANSELFRVNESGNGIFAGTMTSGNITTTGTITLPNSNTLTGSSGKVAFSGRVSGSTPTGTTDFTTKAYVDLQISNLVDSAPSTLDTLNELAAALGDDANFSTTVTNSIAAKLPLAGGTMSGDIVMGNNDITGLKFIQANGNVDIRTGSGEYAIHATQDGQTSLYHNGTKKFETTSVGIDVTGEVQGDSLDIDGNADISGTTTTSGNITATASNATISAAESGGATTKIMGASVGRVGTSSDHNLEILSSNTAAITVDTSQKVGIGVSPTNTLDVRGASSVNGTTLGIDNTYGESPKILQFTYSGNVPVAKVIGFGRHSTGNLPYFAIEVNNTTSSAASTSTVERLRITNEGRVGIGTTTPAEPLDVVGTARMDNSIVEGTLYTGDSVQHWGDGGTGMYFDTDEVLLKTASTTALTINSSQNATFAGDLAISAGALSITADGSNATVMSESGSGDFEINTAGTMVLDSSGEIQVRDDGSTYGYIFNNSNNLAIKSAVNDADMKFIGVDNSSSITALLLDMSDAGAAYFNSWIYTASGGIGRDAHNVIDFSTDNQITAKTNNTTALTINSSQNATFGGTINSGSITTTGHLQVSSSYPRIYLTDTDTNDDYSIINNNGTFIVYNDTDSSIPLAIAGDNKVTILGNLDFSNNKGLTWAGSHSVRVESNVLKLNASGGIQLQNNATFQGSITGKDSGIVIDSIGGPYGRIHGTSAIFLGGGSTTSVQLSAALLPDSDSARALGSSTRYWSHGYIDAVTTTGNVIVGGTIEAQNSVEIGYQTNTSGTTGTTFLELDNNVGGDLSQQQTFIDFKFTDANANYTPQVRIGAQVGPDADADSIEKEGAGSFVVYTAPIGSDSSGNSSGLAESMRVSHDGDVTIAGSVTANGTTLTGNTGTVTGTGTDNRIAIWNGTTAIDSDSDFRVDGDTIFTHNLEAAGNITVAGTVDGRDVAADGAKAVTAHGWGNHGDAGYLTGITSSQVTTALGFTPMNATTTTISSAQATKLGHITVTAGVDLDEVSSNAEGAVQLTGSQTISGGKTFSAATAFTNTTQSTSKTTGAVKLSGGMGIAKTLNVGEDVVAYASSDERYKDNLQVITNPIDKVKSLNGYTFTWNDKHEQFNGNNDIGVVAQEVEKVLPEIVDTRDNGYKAVKYEKMVALLIEAVKDQQEQIDKLKQRLDGCSC